jgi:hypothetical protein
MGEWVHEEYRDIYAERIDVNGAFKAEQWISAQAGTEG